MDLNKAMDLTDDETRALPVEDKVRLAAEAWDKLPDDEKDIVVFMAALSILEGNAEFSVARKIFELGDRDGIDTPPEWASVIDEAEAEQKRLQEMRKIFDL
jgi:hypothetical protein